jgi:hypothetical protein
MSSASTDNSTSNNLLNNNSADMANKALNSSHDDIPMNLLPAGN